MTNVNGLFRDHVTLTVDCTDRIYLNGYMKELLGLTGRSLRGWRSSAKTAGCHGVPEQQGTLTSFAAWWMATR